MRESLHSPISPTRAPSPFCTPAWGPGPGTLASAGSAPGWAGSPHIAPRTSRFGSCGSEVPAGRSALRLDSIQVTHDERSGVITSARPAPLRLYPPHSLGNSPGHSDSWNPRRPQNWCLSLQQRHHTRSPRRRTRITDDWTMAAVLRGVRLPRVSSFSPRLVRRHWQSHKCQKVRVVSELSRQLLPQSPELDGKKVLRLLHFGDVKKFIHKT